MATIERMVVAWTGQTGLPGVSVFYGAVGGSLDSDLVTFFNAIKAAFTNTLSWSVPGAGDTIDDSTGTLNGTWSGGGSPTTITGTATGNFAAGCGAYVNWNTGVVVGSRRLMGRTFLTNLSSAMYDSVGTLDTGIRSVFQTAANNLATTGDLLIWHRPLPGGATGVSHPAAIATVPDQVTSLRSRRR